MSACCDHGVGYEGIHGLGCGCPDPADCECFLDDCFGEDCPYCAVADPSLPCPIADQPPITHSQSSDS